MTLSGDVPSTSYSGVPPLVVCPHGGVLPLVPDTQSWCTGYPEICPSTDCLMPLNVANNETFDRIEKLMGECTGGKASTPGKPSGLFPDGFIHLVRQEE